MNRGALLSLSLFVLALASTAQDDPVRVHIIGASVSGGFRDGPLWGAKERGDSVTLQHVLKRWADGQARVTTHNTLEMAAFFSKPMAIGRNQLRVLKKKKPDIVVALDFPFWFAYGPAGRSGEDGRLAKLAAGLALLEDLDVPILIGDLPDMTGAAQRMLQSSWIPQVETQKRLNAELAAWVKARPKVRLIELSTVVRQMRDEGLTLPLEAGPLQTPKGALQQGDRLHANRLGMAYLGYTLQRTLTGAFPKDHPLHAQKWTLDEFVEAAGAEDVLEALAETETAAGDGK